MASELTDEEIFKAAWHMADSLGADGGRVKAGLDALREAGRLPIIPDDLSGINSGLIDEARYVEQNFGKTYLSGLVLKLGAALELEARTPGAVAELLSRGDAELMRMQRNDIQALTARLDGVRALAHQHRSAEQHNETVPLSDIGDLIGEPSSAEYFAALDGAPEPEAGTKVVIGKQNRGDDDESWTFTEWEPFELEKAREEFPNSVYEVVTVFGLPVEGESDGA